MLFPKDFITLQWDFAVRISSLGTIDLPSALLHYTYFYLSFGLSRDFDPQHPVWQSYLAGLKDLTDGAVWSYSFYIQRTAELPPRQPPEHSFGCFSYALWPENRLRLHFRNAEPDGISPLSTSRLPARLAELKSLFTDLKSRVGDFGCVVGGSWLYNLPAYRRLFPPQYLSSAHPSYEDFPYIALWGQFLNRDGQLRPEHAAFFRRNLVSAATLQQAKEAFPFPLLRLEGNISEFFNYYGIS